MEALERLRRDPVLFAERLLGFRPFPYQARILSDPSPRIVACLGRQTGKTTTIALKAVHFAYCNAETITLIVSPSLRQSTIMFDRILDFIGGSRWLRGSVVRRTRTLIELSNGSRIIALPCSEHLLRGYTADLIVVDEAAFLEDEVITDILFPMLATTGGRLILLSTPWGTGNFFHRAFCDPAWSTHRVESSQNPLIPEGFLEEQRRRMTRESYAMEYEARFVDAATSYFPMDLIRECVATYLQFESLDDFRPGDYYGGLDLGKLQDNSVLAVVAGGDPVRLVYLKEFRLGTPYPEVIDDVVEVDRRLSLRRLLVDRSGIGEAVMDELRRKGVDTAEGATFTRPKKVEYMAYMKLMMQQGRFKMPYDQVLISQMNEQRYEYSPSGQIRFWHPPGSHDDQLWALALALWATKNNNERVVIVK